MRNWEQLGTGTAKNWGERGGGNRRIGEDKETEELSPLGAESWRNAGHRGQQTKNDQQENGQQRSLPLRRLEWLGAEASGVAGEQGDPGVQLRLRG